MKRLNKVTKGTKGRITGVEGDSHFQSKITSMGITVGAEIEIVSNQKKYPIIVFSRDIVFDMEVENTDYASYSKDSKEKNTSIAKAFLDEISEAGYYAMLYTFKSFADSNLNMQDLRDYGFWLAQYNSQPTYSGNFGIWQYTDKGRVSGITENTVDLNYAYQDYPRIIKSAGLNNLGGNAVEPPVTEGGDDCVPEEEFLAERERRKKADLELDEAKSNLASAEKTIQRQKEDLNDIKEIVNK